MTKAFSLVELSIVLVILGLLTGGILAGQSLIRASELRAASTEYQRYVTAVQTFREKYMAIPGDMPNATRFWGRLNGNADCITNSGAAVSTNGTCDGGGNGFLASATAVSESAEIFQFWRQLALAGMIEGSYSGLSGSASVADAIVNTNVPASKLSNAGWSAYAIISGGVYGGDAALVAMEYGNSFTLGAKSTLMFYPAFTPEEAWNIDTKLDDGKPAQGSVIARYWGTCTNGTQTSLTADYTLTATTKLCGLYFRKAF